MRLSEGYLLILVSFQSVSIRLSYTRLSVKNGHFYMFFEFFTMFECELELLMSKFLLSTPKYIRKR